MFYSVLVQGLRRSWQLREILFFFVALNLGITLLFTTPYISSFVDFFSNRIITHLLARQDFYTFYAEFSYYMAPLIKLSKQCLAAGIILHFLMTTFFLGGLIHFFWINNRLRWKIFYSQSFRFFFRLLLLVIMLFIMIALIVFVVIIIAFPFTSLLPTPFVENIYFWFYFICLIIIGFLVFFMTVIFDVTRILLVGDNSRSFIQPIVKAIRFFMKYPLQITLLYILLAFLSFLIILIYWILQKYIPDTGNWGIVVGFIFLQIFIYLHYWVRFSRYGALIAFYKCKP